jgi:hypothetical protein
LKPDLGAEKFSRRKRRTENCCGTKTSTLQPVINELEKKRWTASALPMALEEQESSLVGVSSDRQTIYILTFPKPIFQLAVQRNRN